MKNNSVHEFKKTFVLVILFSVFIFFSNSAEAATYTVCNSDCNSVTINGIFSGYNLESDDIVEIRADSIGGSKIYREAVVWGADDGGSENHPVILRARSGDNITIHGDSDSDGIDDIVSTFKIQNVNYVEVQDLTFAHATTDGIIISGTSYGVVVRNATSTYSGNQAFQLMGSASATYYNIVGNNNADDGFSMHGTTTAIIHGGSFSNNLDGINFIDNSTLTATDIIINNSGSEAIFPIDSANNGGVITANFTNVTIDQTLGSSTDRVIEAHGANVNLTINNLTINNVPSGSSTECIMVGYGAKLNLNKFTLNGNILKNGIAVYDATSILTINGGKINNTKYGITNSGNGVIIANGLEILNSTIGIYDTGKLGLNINRSYFHNISGMNIDIRTSGETVNISNSIFSELAGGNFGVACRLGSICNLYNNTFYDSNKDGNGIFAASSTVVNAHNNIFTNLAGAIHKIAGASIIASYNSVYGNTNDWPGLVVSNTNAINGNPFLYNPASADFSLQSLSPAIDSGYNFGTTYKDALSPSSAWPSSVIAIDQNLRGSGWDVGAYVYPVPQSPVISTNLVSSSSAIRYNFVDTSSDEIGFKLYDNTNTEVNSVATSDISSIDEINLSENTKYFGRYIKAYNNLGASVASATSSSIYTLVDPPTNLVASSTTNSISLSVDSFPNDSSDLSGYYFSRSGVNSGWIQLNHWQDINLSCGTEYTYQVKYRNGDGAETTYGFISLSTVNCAPTNLSYTSPNTYTKNSVITPLSPSITGSELTYSVSPSLPTGLLLATSTGIISGTPTATSTQNTYTVTATNSGGNTTFGVDITVNNAAPIISQIQSSGNTITFLTDEPASTLIEYGLTNSYGSQTVEGDTSPRVTSHYIAMSNLSSCTTYHYRVRSKDINLTEAVSSDRTFTTTGCTASSAVSENQTSQVDKTTGGTLTLKDSNLNGLALNIPVAFATSSANFQAHKLDRDTVLNTISKPSGVVSAGNYIYELKALSSSSSTISVFDNPLTISITYSSSDISGVDESSLKIYRWDTGVWTQLSNCSVNTNTKTVTCETSHFSTFGLFGQETVNDTTSSDSSLIINTPCSSVVYDSWQETCMNGRQFRNILSQAPNLCSLTTEQRAQTERICGETANTEINQVSSIENVYNYERSALSKIIDKKLSAKLAGRILLQVETKGQAWYLDTKSLTRYYLADGHSAYQALRQFGLGITNIDLNKIPVAPTSVLPSDYIKATNFSNNLVNRLKGKILLQVENRGEAWYVNPKDGLRYYLANGEAAYQIMRQLSLGITNENIWKIRVGDFK